MLSKSPTVKIASPCVRNCCLDENDICVGCFRSLDEILNWSTVSNDERCSITSRASERKAKATKLLTN